MLLALLLTAPLAATVWSRRNLSVRIPKTAPVTLEDATYSGRDWSVSLTALEAKPDPGRAAAPGSLGTIWTFHYTNTDREPHYVAVTVRCLDLQRKERSLFKANVTLLADRPDGAKAEIAVKMREADWSAAAMARIMVDFLSGPEG